MIHPSYSKNLFSHVGAVLCLSMVLIRKFIIDFTLSMWIEVLEFLNTMHHNIYFLIYKICFLICPSTASHIEMPFFYMYLFNHPTVDYLICSGNQNHTPMTDIHQPVLQSCFGSTVEYTRYSTRYNTEGPAKKGWVMVSAKCGLWKLSSSSGQYHGKDNFWDQCKNVKSLFGKVLYCHALPPQRYMKPQKP